MKRGLFLVAFMMAHRRDPLKTDRIKSHERKTKQFVDFLIC